MPAGLLVDEVTERSQVQKQSAPHQDGCKLESVTTDMLEFSQIAVTKILADA